MDRKIEKKKWPPKKIATVGVSALFVIIVLYSLIFGDKSSKLNVQTEKITISEVTYGEFQEFIPIIGTVRPFETHYLSASDGGAVERRIIESGTYVKKGDPIVQLSNTNLLLTILNNQAQVNRASNDLRATRLSMEQNSLQLKSQMANLKYDLYIKRKAYERSQKLHNKDLISEEDFELAREEYDYAAKRMELTIESMKQDSLFRLSQIRQLEESLEQMNTNLEIVRQKQDNLTIKAPISGLLSSLDAEIGDTKVQGERIGQIDVIDHFKIRAGIDEYYIARVDVGQTGTFDFAGSQYKLMVDKVYQEVVEGRFEVDMVFTDETPDGIRRGQTQHIRLVLGDLAEATLIPRGGFFQTTGGQWIYVVDKSGNFAERRSIKLGRYNAQVYEVLEGLEPGEQVITSSYDSYGDIDKLILKN